MAGERLWSAMDLEARKARVKADFEAGNAQLVAETEAEIAALDAKIAAASKELEKVTTWWTREDIEGGIASMEDDAFWLQKHIRHATSADSFRAYVEDMANDLFEACQDLEESIRDHAARASEAAGDAKASLLAAGEAMLADYKEKRAHLEALAAILG